MHKIWPLLAILLYLYLTTPIAGQQQPVTILYFTDAHELAPVTDQMGERGGVARLKTVIQTVRKQAPNTLLAFGGDLGGGVLFGAVFQGLPMVEALNLLDVDVATFGQHDFDFGVDQTERLVKTSRFPWITSNLTDASGRSFLGLPRTLILNRNNIRIGFLGLTDAMNTTAQDNRVHQVELVHAARIAVTEIQEKGTDVIIALTQASLSVNEHLLLEIPEIDAILSEERNEIRSTAHFVGNRPILTPCGNLGSVVRLEIHLEPESRPTCFATALPVDPSVPGDTTLVELQNRYMTELEHRLSEPLAVLETPLESGMYGNNAMRFQETNAGNLITDAYRAFYKADIGILNGGGIRANAKAGTFTLKEALSLLPFANRICLIELNGAQLLRTLEHGVSGVEKRSGAFCQVSGMAYTYAPGRPPGQRIIEAHVNSQPIDLHKKYTVALPDYLLEGGDGFSVLKEAHVLVDPEKSPLDITLFSDYCRTLQHINTPLEGRIKIQNQ